MTTFKTIGLVSLALVLSACGSKDGGDSGDTTMTTPDVPTTTTAPTTPTTNPTTPTTPTTSAGTVLDVAAAVGGFDTLIVAVDAAGLTDTLNGDGPFTVLAPTDDAFNALPAGVLDGLLADVPALTDTLLYHVVDGNVPSSDVVMASLVATLNGSDVKVTLDGDDVFINDAQVTLTDVAADNGVIHVLDTVLTPPGSIADIAVADPNFSTLVTALAAADLVDTLSGDGTFTVFAPTNAAFDALPAGTLDSLLADIPALTDVLLYHVADTKMDAADVLAATSISMMSGDDAAVAMDGSTPTIAGAPISATDIPASNGVVHVIDAVMLP
jgi:uncharacterized surface protein with fasciclin (FAS1) repeats